MELHFFIGVSLNFHCARDCSENPFFSNSKNLIIKKDCNKKPARRERPKNIKANLDRG